MKTVLITGANSYIGTSFEKYVKEHFSNQLSIDTIDMVDGSWRKKPFQSADGKAYDCIFHVAGLAHADVGKVDEATKAKYYAVNTDLAIETAKKAKEDGVGQFVFISSAIIYGAFATVGVKKVITKDTQPSPANFYGDSKWKADKGVRELAGDDFTVTVLRSPMIYGKGSKGNYTQLSKMARKLPVFPEIENQRSMLYIENLCEFLCQVMMRGEGGIFWPQNASYSNTSKIVRYIGHLHGHKVIPSKLMGVAVKAAAHIPGKIGGLCNKAFGNLTYEKSMSVYKGISYQKYGVKESLIRTEIPQIQDTNSDENKANSIKFSIITICFNSEAVIKKTIESVLAQDYTGSVEYLIIDGASKDKTVEIAEEYRDEFAKRGYEYRIISEPDNGIYDAMNKGIRQSTGDIVAILNSDDWYETDAISTAANEYEKMPYDYFFADINLVKDDGRIITKHSRIDIFPSSRRWNHPSSFVKKKLYEEIGVFRDEGLHDDFEFYLRVRKSNKIIRVVNHTIANFVVGGASNQKGFKKSKSRIEDRYRAYRVNGYSRLYMIECIGVEIAKAIIS